MLFSAWHEVTHAPQPVHLSRSAAIPHFGMKEPLTTKSTRITKTHIGFVYFVAFVTFVVTVCVRHVLLNRQRTEPVVHPVH
jgi:hypothetical protein